MFRDPRILPEKNIPVSHIISRAGMSKAQKKIFHTAF
jgi:hypothetical protein